MKVPKDLGLKIGTPLEVMWTNVAKNVEAEIKLSEDELIVKKELLKIARLKIALEQKRRKV